MQPRNRSRRGAFLKPVLGLLIVAILQTACSDSPAFYVTVTQWPAGSARLSVTTTTTIGGQTYNEVPGPQQRIIVPLPQGVTGMVSLGAMALDSDGCAVASAEQKVEAPAGLRRYREVTLELLSMATALCPVSVTIDSGPLQVTAQPPSLSIDGVAAGTVQAMLEEGRSLQLHAQDPSASEGYVEWSECVVGADCSTRVRRGLQIHVARRDFSCSSDRWCWRYPLPEGSNLQAIWGRDAKDIWAVGHYGTVLHWDGTAWSKIYTGITRTLQSVWGADADNVWAVGDDGYILKWDGNSWSPRTSGTSALLQSVHGVSASAIWVVGDGGVALNWDGAAWKMLPNFQNLFYLHGIWAESATTVWTTGYSGIIGKWNGSTWTSFSTPIRENMFGIFGTGPNDIWLSGNNQINRWDGTRWSPSLIGHPATLTGLWGASSKDLWAVGKGRSIVRWDGAAWKVVSGGVLAGAFSMWGSSPNDLWVGGDQGKLLHWNGQSWTAQPAFTTVDISDLFGLDANNVWAVTSAGTIVKWDGATWNVQASGVPWNLRAISGLDASNVWAVGEQGLVLKWNGARWTRQVSGTENDIYRVQPLSTGQVWLGGEGGLVMLQR